MNSDDAAPQSEDIGSARAENGAAKTDETTGPTHADEHPDLDDGVLDSLISEELGETIAQVMRLTRRAQESWHRRAYPKEGLRERKRRQTRQLISDAATLLFATRGFDNVTVSEVADRVGVSEKTVYNYFPNKESMVLDTADESIERLVQALRGRAPGETLTDTMVRAIKADNERFDESPDELLQFIPPFMAMVMRTPPLRAAWLELNDRLARVVRDELAAAAGVDPRDPEPTAAARAMVGLVDVATQSRVRHIEAGLRGEQLRAAVSEDLDRGARLLETGLWSFNLPRGARAKNQAQEAARAAEEARVQVVKALKEARAAWQEVRRQSREVRDAARGQGRESHHARMPESGKGDDRR